MQLLLLFKFLHEACFELNTSSSFHFFELSNLKAKMKIIANASVRAEKEIPANRRSESHSCV
jgi:hypothetical protein